MSHIWPKPPTKVSDEYGPRNIDVPGASKLHGGMDFGWCAGEEIPATASGVVVWAGPNGGEGNSVYVDHQDGILTKYFHMDTIAVERGQVVAQGESLGIVGDTGVSGGPHLHWETWVAGTRWNPRDFMTTYGGTAPATAAPSRRRRNNMDKIIIGFADTGAYSVFDLRNPAETRERYQAISDTSDLVRLEGIYGDRQTYANQGEWDAVRTRYGLGNQVA